MKAIARDVSRSVFDNDTEAILYMIKDTEGVDDCYIFSLPIYTFSIREAENDKVEELLKWQSGFLHDKSRKEQFIAEMNT